MSAVAKTEPSVELVKTMQQAMALEAEMPGITDPQEVQTSIQAQILAAASDEDILDAGSTSLLSTEDMVDRTITILDFTLHKTQFSSGNPVYAVVKAVSPEGLDVMFTTGSTTLLTQLWALAQKTPFEKRPDGIKVSVRGKQTSSGNTVFFLAKA